MKNSVLEKYAKPPAERRTVEIGDDEELDDLGFFGWLRGVRERAIMLEFRERDGHITAFSYHSLDRAELDPSGSMILSFMGRSVKIVGRNLNAEVRQNVRLFNGIVRHRVPWIQEFDEPAILSAATGTPVVERIDVK